MNPHDITAKSVHGQLGRTLSVIELLAHNARGLPLFEIADGLAIPRSATHRVLARLTERGYVRQERVQGNYLLTAKIVSLGFTFLAGTGIPGLVQPVLDRLARDSGELVRLAVLDGTSLTFVAKAVGTPDGLRYDADMGQPARLSCSASGVAFLASFDDAAALAIANRQGFGTREEFGPRAPQTEAALLKLVRAARKRGYSVTDRTYSPTMAAMAGVLRRPDTREASGTITIAGPYRRLTVARMEALAPLLHDAVQELSRATLSAPVLFGQRRVLFGP
jgi:IclR family transcriptional regulator, acetate operon repressor